MSLDIIHFEGDLEKEIAAAEKHVRRDAVTNAIRYSIVAILLAIVPLGGLWLVVDTFYGAYEESQRHQELERNGVETDAYLQGQYVEVSSKSGKTFRLRYSFKINNQYFYGESEVDKLPVSFGIPQRVVYDPEHPENNKLKGGKDRFDYQEIPFIGKMSVLILLAIIAGLIKYGSKLKKAPNLPNSSARRTRFVVDEDGVVRDQSGE